MTNVAGQTLPAVNLKYSSYAAAADGSFLDYLAVPHRVEIQGTSAVSRHVIDALIATEDRDFYSHDGVSLKGLGRALFNTLTGRTQGGSTLTMQLARNLFLSNDRSISRKLAEIDLAREIEKKYTKEQILTLYLNTVYFGRGAYGIWSAAREFFGAGPESLSMIESATLIGLLQAPSAYDPSKHPEKARARRNEVLHNLVEVGKLSQKDFNALKKRPLGLRLREEQGRHLLEYARREAAEILKAAGRSLDNEQMRITVTIDPMIQRAMEGAVEAQWKLFPRNLQKVQVGLASIETGKGAIKAMIGGAPGSNPRGLNHASQIRRQPGSAFKPFLYGQLLEKGLTLATPIEDSPIVVDSGLAWEWRPGNDDDSWSGAKLPMISVIQRSLNLAAAHAIVELTAPADVAYFARRCGINSELREYPSLALGTSEVSPLEMAAATAVFPAYGLRARPYSVARIDDKYGRLIYAARPDTATVLDSATAFLLTTALETVVDSGTARVIRGTYTGAAAGKTGTTQKSTDAWFVGYTPRLCTAIWIGFDDPSNVLTGAFRYGGAACAPIWGKAMAEVSRNGRSADSAFTAPSTVTYVHLCSRTGDLAVEDCPEKIFAPVNALRPPAECREHGRGFFGW